MFNFAIVCYTKQAYHRVRKALRIHKTKHITRKSNEHFYILTESKPKEINNLTGCELYTMKPYSQMEEAHA